MYGFDQLDAVTLDPFWELFCTSCLSEENLRMKTITALSALSVFALSATAGAQAVQVNVNAQVAVPTVTTPQVVVQQPTVPTVAIAQPVASPVVVVPTNAQWAAADDDPSQEPEMRATMAPPAMQAEVQTAMPGQGFVWVPGYWRWRGNRYVWRAGAWKRPQHPNHQWVPGQWQAVGNQFVWVRGHWDNRPGVAVVPNGPGVVVNQPGPGVVVARPNGAVVVNQPGPGVVVARPNGNVVVNTPGPGAVVARPNGSVVIRRPGPNVVVGPHGGVHIQGGGHGRGH